MAVSMEPGLKAGHPRAAKALRWAGRVIGLMASGFFLMFLGGEAVDSVIAEGLQGLILEGLFVAIPGFIALAGCIVSWWRIRLAGVLLVIAYFLWGVRPTIAVFFFRGGDVWDALVHNTTWWIMTLPFFVSGVLLLISAGVARETRQSADPSATS